MSLADAVTLDHEIQALVVQAGERLPRFYPLDAFVASNPLHGFEDYTFEHALRRAASLFDGRGHLDLPAYRARLAAGTIDARALRAAIAAHLPDRDFVLGDQRIALHEQAWRLATQDETPLAELAPLLAAARGLLAATASPTTDAGAWSPRLQHVLRWMDQVTGSDLLARHDALLHPYLQATLLPDPNDGCVVAPGAGIYRRFLALLAREPATTTVRTASDIATAALLPEDPLAAIQACLAALGVRAVERAAVIEQALFALKGWAAFVNWSRQHANGTVTLLELTAMSLLTTRLLLGEFAVMRGLGPAPSQLLKELATATTACETSDVRRLAAIAQANAIDPTRLARSSALVARSLLDALAPCDETWLALRFLEAAEAGYRDGLLAGITGRARRAAATPATAEAATPPTAQVVFCIDVRSEPMRRALERAGPFDTYGYAGFFGAAVRLHHADGSSSDRCPALIAPTHAAWERPAAGQPAAEVIAEVRNEAARAALGGQLKRHPLAAFGLVDGFGLLALKSLLGGAWRRAPGNTPGISSSPLEPRLAADEAATTTHGPAAMSEDDQFAVARALFATTALGAPWGRLLVLCAHGSNTVNNPWASALDCGACGGHDGASNARLVAAILARPSIRARLASAGFDLPASTVVVAAIHDTTTDRVSVLDRDLVPASHAADLTRLEAALAQATRAVRKARARLLAEASADGPARRAGDIAETRPEWGLARNAAFIAAPRATTRGLDLEGRCFLHSYDWRSDVDGSVLTTIMSAPMVVAQWINAHYYFASVDNAAFGAGSKVTQNIVGGRAVVQGEYGDLCLGLPAQSVRAADGTLYHEPLRLLVVLQAPAARVEAVLSAQAQVARLFDNAWLHLVVLDDDTGHQLRYRPGGTWQQLGPWRTATMPQRLAS